MTPENLAMLHARAMPDTRAWSAKSFTDLLAIPGTFLTPIPSSLQIYAGGSEQSERGAAPPTAATTKSAQKILAFALGRVTLDEAELLTLAVDPAHQRQGLGRQCLAQFEAKAQENGATRAFLEVAASNHAALALYRNTGWTQDGTRPNYYATATGREDAILFSKCLKPA